MSPIMETLTGIMIAILIYYSENLLAMEKLELIIFSILGCNDVGYQPVRSLSTLNMVLNQGLSAASRILPIIDQKHEIKNKENAKTLSINKAEINFKNLNFSYNIDDKKTLTSIDLNFNGGEMTSLVGHSGSGKSTILNLIPRFYDPQSGDITIDNQSIYNCTLDSLETKYQW